MATDNKTTLVVTLPTDQLDRMDAFAQTGNHGNRDAILQEALDLWLRRAEARESERKGFILLGRVTLSSAGQPASPGSVRRSRR